MTLELSVVAWSSRVRQLPMVLCRRKEGKESEEGGVKQFNRGPAMAPSNLTVLTTNSTSVVGVLFFYGVKTPRSLGSYSPATVWLYVDNVWGGVAWWSGSPSTLRGTG